jgi:hypothetical protein
MNPTPQDCVVTGGHGSDDFSLRPFKKVFLLLGGLSLCLPLYAQSPSGQDWSATRSVSGQFIISGITGFSPLAHSPQMIADTNLVRLEPATLSVTAERIKRSLWRDLGVTDPAGQEKFFLVLHRADSLADEVTISAVPFGRRWNYRIELPDVLPLSRFARALTGALLLDYANQHADPSQPAPEIPDWLVDGLAQRLLASEAQNLILSSPAAAVDGLAQVRTVENQRGMDPLADARRILKNASALSFEQMSWPTESQTDGDDGGVYLASAEVFADALLNLKDGPAGLRALLEKLPACENWQTAFQSAFQPDFPRPLDLEKWWAVQEVDFVARDFGPAWTPEVSREKLDEILSVPVAVREDSNALPSHAEISMQAVIRNFDSEQQTSILELKLRDLEATELRLAVPLADLADAYRLALAAYLGERSDLPVLRPAPRESVDSRRTSASSTLKKLDALDHLRLRVESAVKPDVLQPRPF